MYYEYSEDKDIIGLYQGRQHSVAKPMFIQIQCCLYGINKRRLVKLKVQLVGG